MNRDAYPTRLRCSSCGAQTQSDGSGESIGKTYQVIVACASCGSSLVVLSRN